MRTVSATEFKAKCLQLLDMVQATGEEIVISKRGKPVARVVAERQAKPWLALRGMGGYIGDPFEPAIQESDIEAMRE